MFSRIMPVHSAGGMQDHVQTLSAGLVKRGHQVTVITTARADDVEFEIIEGVHVHFLSGTVAGRYSRAFWEKSVRKFEELHARVPFDVVHSQSIAACGVFARQLPRKYGLPLVTSLHGTHLDVLTTSWHTDFLSARPQGIVRFGAVAVKMFFDYLTRDVWFIRGSDILIATSDADVWKYTTLYRVPVKRIRKVYNGIDTQLFSPSPISSLQSLRAGLNIDPDAKIILALARLQKDKGVQNAIAVMPRVLAQMRAVLIIVGDGDYRATLEKLARDLGVAEHVRFVGTQPLAECARYFNLCDVFVNPTLRTDGYDLTIAEAMACAKPVIVSDVGANSTLIDRATMRDGILIPRGDNDALAREIVRVLNDPTLARAMGERAREKIVARFSIEAMVSGMEKVYEEVCFGKKQIQ
ncbi:MAG: glycosyltransferase family 4 protein [Anaerolineae bacterium]|nr:glycosyltransferase family 4 protein [Anaerolineae bacterium]